MDEDLARFAHHTRHTEREVNGQRNQIARKYMALSFGGPEAYAHVASDYEWVNRRTCNPPLHAYVEHELPSADALIGITRDAWPRKQPIDRNDPKMPSIGAFCDALFPVDAREEAWRPHTRDNHWQQRAAFFISHRLGHPEAREVLGRVLSEGPEAESRSPAQQQLHENDVWRRMVDYAQEIGICTTPSEWGAILRGATELPEDTTIALGAASATLPDTVEDDKPEVIGAALTVVNTLPPAVIRSAAAPRAASLEQWARTAAVSAWRRAQVLSPMTDPVALCRQYVQARADDADAVQLLADHCGAEDLQDLAHEHLEPGREYSVQEALEASPELARLAAQRVLC